jgi:hypothetical protein
MEGAALYDDFGNYIGPELSGESEEVLRHCSAAACVRMAGRGTCCCFSGCNWGCSEILWNNSEHASCVRLLRVASLAAGMHCVGHLQRCMTMAHTAEQDDDAEEEVEQPDEDDLDEAEAAANARMDATEGADAMEEDEEPGTQVRKGFGRQFGDRHWRWRRPALQLCCTAVLHEGPALTT